VTTPPEAPFDAASANVLITGGSEGIGLGLARRFRDAGAQVMVTGRSIDKLDAAASATPGLLTVVNDIGLPGEREALAAHVLNAMPGLNVLINNAGIQRRISLADDTASWGERQSEIDILLAGPVHLNHLLVPHILAHGRPSLIANVTSGGGYTPQIFAPVYSACKAAVHSYTVTLRHALAGTSCAVLEIIPPRVQTALGGGSVTFGAPLDEFCDAVFAGILALHPNIGFGPTATPEFEAAQQPYVAMFEALNASRPPVKTYK